MYTGAGIVIGNQVGGGERGESGYMSMGSMPKSIIKKTVPTRLRLDLARFWWIPLAVAREGLDLMVMFLKKILK